MFQVTGESLQHTVTMLHTVWAICFDNGVRQHLEEKISLCYIQKLIRYIYLKEFSKFTKNWMWREEHKSEY